MLTNVTLYLGSSIAVFFSSTAACAATQPQLAAAVACPAQLRRCLSVWFACSALEMPFTGALH